MTGDTHYDLEILAELAEGLLDAATAEQVRAHLALCDPCGELLADLAAVREVLAATPTPAMPMGVAMRIDQALAREASGGRVGLVESPDWDELTREVQPEPVRLGVVADDGSVVPARQRRSTRRRRWAMPAVAAAAAAVVVGTAAVGTSLLTGGGSPAAPVEKNVMAQPQPSKSSLGYVVTDTDYNWSADDLKQPLRVFFAPAPAAEGGGVDSKVTACVSKVSNRSKLKPFMVDQSEFNGQEALIIASWKDKVDQRVRVDVVDPFKCKNIVKPTLGSWN
ncbi:anti-sigma factor family protein [Nonomuraea sp. NPDC059194]|uniref:anti-sigma factor family protein n=1 Tax=Nonomuraea sp. NPDC059194 TaxID=3346764 RepID=UPI00368B9ED8